MKTFTSKLRMLFIATGVITFFIGITISFIYDNTNLLVAYGGMISAIGLFVSMIPKIKKEKIAVTK